MGLNVSLMAVTSGIMSWVIRTENGGVMNFLFSVTYPSQGGDPEFEINNDLQQHVMDYFMNSLLLRPLDLKVLQALPESMGGGKSGVDESHAHPNREATIFWLTVSLFLLTTILIVLIQIMTCCCCCLKSSGGDVVSSVNKASSKANFNHKSLVFRVLYIATLVIALAFLAAAIVLVIVYFTATAMTVSYLESNPQSSPNEGSTSLPDGLRSTGEHLRAFITSGVKSGQATTSNAVNIFQDLTRVCFQISLNIDPWCNILRIITFFSFSLLLILINVLGIKSAYY
ncbi:unnamed protein product [Hymenolepis diminuta]|uniref:Uncharacterized protein n=1 Tax=Hymenolepis diminuta TaxID=6216 RepID=A0A564ZA30_HYMDI|nr:unnamed protein product [Hymenolepis diminuta]